MQTSVDASDDEHNRGSAAHWSQANLRRLRVLIKNTAVVSMLDLTSSRPGEPVTLGEVAAASGCTRPQVMGGLAVLTKTIRKEFEFDKWPVEYTTHGGLSAYVMSPEVAAAWKEVARQQG